MYSKIFQYVLNMHLIPIALLEKCKKEIQKSFTFNILLKKISL